MGGTGQVRQRGSLTPPASLREGYKMQPGDPLKSSDLDGILVPMPMTPLVPELACEIDRARRVR
jgi:hypothetical protein